MKGAAMPLTSRHRADAGMTLIEILVGLVIFSLVTVALTTILFSSTRVGTRTAKRADVQGGCRQALSLMSTELRQAGVDPRIPPVGIVGIMSADSVNIRVRGDLNGDGVIQTTEPSEDVTYSFVDSTGVLSRNPGAGAQVVLSNITDMRLTYFDASNTPLTALPLSATDAARVLSIGVSITAEEADSRPITLATRITLRNR